MVSLPQDILVAAGDATRGQPWSSGNLHYAPVCMKSNVSSLRRQTREEGLTYILEWEPSRCDLVQSHAETVDICRCCPYRRVVERLWCPPSYCAKRCKEKEKKRKEKKKKRKEKKKREKKKMSVCWQKIKRREDKRWRWELTFSRNCRRIRADLGQAKVNQLQGGPISWQHKVRRFDVSVQHAGHTRVQNVDTDSRLVR